MKANEKKHIQTHTHSYMHTFNSDPNSNSNATHSDEMNDLEEKKEIETTATSCYYILFIKLIAYSRCFHFRRCRQNAKQ